ncbi:unnamed protein product [Lactuca saligna]|uniref:Uncharacterized protein n=1 Tax=Lactuca saligna TaxID=75948 RepID=A0AA35ZJR0_LACSI|nr:unnamed protein product [Lactuca saligna]
MTSRKNIDHWLEGKGKMYQSNTYSKEQIHDAYEKYVNTSSSGRSSSKDSNISVKAWRPVTKAKPVQSQTQKAKDHAVDDEVHAPDNHIPEFVKLTDESTSTSQQSESMQNSHVEGEKLDSNTLNDEEHSFEGEKDQMNIEVEGEHIVEGEHNVDDAFSNAGLENDEIYEDAPLEFDPAYPPMEKRTRDHPKDQIMMMIQRGQSKQYKGQSIDSSILTRILLPREEKKSKKSKKVAPASPEQKIKGLKSSKSPKKKTANVEVTVDATQVIEPIVEETQENVIIPSKTGMFRRIKIKYTHKRKSLSQ